MKKYDEIIENTFIIVKMKFYSWKKERNVYVYVYANAAPVFRPMSCSILQTPDTDENLYHKIIHKKYCCGYPMDIIHLTVECGFES